MQSAHATLTAAALIAAASVSTATAQPFVHSIAEPFEALELANDLTVMSSGDVLFVGGFAEPLTNLQSLGYIVVADTAGVPLISWIVDDPETESEQAFAVRQDPNDDAFIIAQHGDQSLSTTIQNTLLYKFDPAGQSLLYEWRYPMGTDGNNLGMELVQDIGYIGAHTQNQFGVNDPTMLIFDPATGLPITFNRYETFNEFFGGAKFVDVHFDPQTKLIHAVGTIQVDDPTVGASTSKLLVAQLDQFGIPVWFNAYDALLPDQPGIDFTGVSIELTSSRAVAVTARFDDQNTFPGHLSVLIDPAMGAPLKAIALQLPEGIIEPAYSSLEIHGEQQMVMSGMYTDRVQGQPVPVMWAIDENSLNLSWIWSPDGTEGVGNSVMPLPGQGVYLAGQVFPLATGPVGGFDDALLVQTDDLGEGLCPVIPFYIEFEIPLLHLPVPVEVIGMETPLPAQVDVFFGEPIPEPICSQGLPCPTDLNGDGMTDISDLLLLLAVFNTPSPQGDVNMDGFTDISDLLALLTFFNSACP